MTHFFADAYAIGEVEFKKLLRDPTEIVSRAIQPVLWLTIFGQVFSRVRGIPTGSVSYLAFMTPGILAQSILFSSIFYGIAIIWERDLGIIHKLLVSPANRGALVLGKAFSAACRGFIQAVIIYGLALGMGIKVSLNPLSILGVTVAVLLGSAVFSTFSLIIACLVKTRERFMGIGQVLTMPLFFASSAIYPMELMPDWLQIVARLNPLSYLVDALRGLMLMDEQGLSNLWLDFGVMALTFIAFTVVAAKLYPTLIR